MPNIVEERRFRLFRCAFVAVTVTRQFVAAGDNAPDKFRVTFGHPSQREEGRFCIMVIQHRQDAINVTLDPAFSGWPLAARDVRRERGDLKVIFDVYGEGVGDWFRLHSVSSQAVA